MTPTPAENWLNYRRRVEPVDRRKRTPVKIVCKRTGLDVVMSNGKHMWPNVGAAKCAIRNDVSNRIRGRGEEDTLVKAILELVEFKPL